MRSPNPRPFRAVLLLAACLALAGAGNASTATLRNQIEAIIAPVYRRAFVGLYVLSATRGDVLYALNADRPFVPASNQKLLTSATALATLGPEYRFRTEVLAAGDLHDGVLEGDLILRGGGDPVLMPADLAALARQARERGLRRVTGRLAADESRFDGKRLGLGWEADDESAYYAAQISALSVNRNIVTVNVRPGDAAGAPPAVHVEPLQSFLEIDNGAVTTAGGAVDVDVERARGRNVLVLRGSVPLGSRGRSGIEVTVEDPAMFTALLFRKLLAAEGVTIDGGSTRRTAPAPAVRVAEHLSPPLAEVVRELNKPSDNLIAEMLLKGIGAERAGKGSCEAGLDEVRTLLRQAGADVEGFGPRDGSGLSRHNLVSPRSITLLLKHVRRQPYYPAFLASLPLAGVDGTLRARMNGSPADRSVSAKTGTLSHVSALSGYVRAANGEQLMFSVMTNNFPGSTSRTGPVKRMEDQVAIALARFQR